jgi:hypothetical protein
VLTVKLFFCFRYCEAIGGTLKLATKSSPYYHSHLLSQVKELSDRLMATPQRDTGTSWMLGKVQRPTLDNLWSTLEGQIAKFVAGEEGQGTKSGKPQSDGPGGKGAAAAAGSAAQLGPFSHFSSISPGSTSGGGLSRTHSHNDLPSMAAVPPPSAPSASSYFPAPPSSQVRKHSHKRSVSVGYAPYGNDPYGGSSHYAPQPPPRGASVSEEDTTTPGWMAERGGGGFSQEPMQMNDVGGDGWWEAAHRGAGDGDAFSGDANNDATGRAAGMGASLTAYSGGLAEDASGFISPMGPISPAITPQPSQMNFRASGAATAPPTVDEEDDDLGLGNSRGASSRWADGDQDESGGYKTEGEGRREEPSAKETAKSTAAGKQQGLFFLLR